MAPPRLASAAAAVLLVSGCAPPDPRPSRHDAIVCVGEAATCGEEARGAAFEEWLEPNLVAGSSFEVWARDGSGTPRLAVSVCVPDRWSAGAKRAIAAFVADARARVRAPLTPLPAATPCARAGATRLVLVDGEGRSRAETVDGTAPALHTTIVCDLSGSMSPQPVCEPQHVQRVFDAWASSPGSLARGATFSIDLVGTTRATAKRAFGVTLEAASVPERAMARSNARAAAISALPPPDARAHGSAIAEALHVAAKQLKEKPGRHRVVLLSDLREIGSGWNFEASPISGEAFAASAERLGLVPDLDGADVLVCGHDRTPDGAFGAKRARTVEEAWRTLFAHGRAASSVFRTDCPPSSG